MGLDCFSLLSLEGVFNSLYGAFHKTIRLWIESTRCVTLENSFLANILNLLSLNSDPLTLMTVCGMLNFANILLRYMIIVGECLFVRD